MRSNFFALALAGVGVSSVAANPADLTADQATALLKGVIDSLQTNGDLRATLQQTTPEFTEQNAASPYQSLADSFTSTLNLLPNKNGDVNIGGATAAQAAEICALVPKFVAAGTHAADTLGNLPGFEDSSSDARTSAINLGLALDGLGWQLNMFHWGFINSGAAATCDQATQNAFYTVPNLLMDAGDAILY
ncbi:uncharacterized protein TRIVIDRAFT_67053 [Trichoderma virens Gv29-8]|uniref:Uncharacterized protein n=1 Tax=Hypocrea virens (strain Gv29-8 / FGSC 10586) TaxID=413071 RepID=G9N661_HYPVG|nr:uncharacterized protein TRIVIDRAFT_67053 [Trichoderma virens Gv29-8]EHK17819.1 hypothetical protein TRIVIDRAFT_67053 [Trichoderma virens Gv29-8]UKZ54316.1 hypothetical protein TrVGV298_008124 [Trichoderma virens]